VLGGRLFLRPEGFQEASRDVVRLTPDIDYILSQQGFMLCEPEVVGMEEVPLHVALQAIPAKVGRDRGRRCCCCAFSRDDGTMIFGSRRSSHSPPAPRLLI
jgi:hypothetical protein